MRTAGLHIMREPQSCCHKEGQAPPSTALDQLRALSARACAAAGGGLRLKGYRLKYRSRRVQMMFPIAGSERRGLASLEAKKLRVRPRGPTAPAAPGDELRHTLLPGALSKPPTGSSAYKHWCAAVLRPETSRPPALAMLSKAPVAQGRYIYKLLAVDVPTIDGPEQRVFLAGDEAVYNRGAHRPSAPAGLPCSCTDRQTLPCPHAYPAGKGMHASERGASAAKSNVHGPKRCLQEAARTAGRH